MNDRMHELYASACLYAREQQLDLKDKNVPAFVECMAEKFAELIIKECARIARNTDLENVEGGDSAVLRAAGEQIEKHFGVE